MTRSGIFKKMLRRGTFWRRVRGMAPRLLESAGRGRHDDIVHDGGLHDRQTGLNAARLRHPRDQAVHDIGAGG